MVVRNVDIRNGEISVNLNEELLLKKKSADISHVAIKPINESGTTEKTEKKPAAFAVMREKYASMFPEKVSYFLILIFSNVLDYICLSSLMLW